MIVGLMYLQNGPYLQALLFAAVSVVVILYAYSELRGVK